MTAPADQSILGTSVEGYPQERIRNLMPTEMTDDSRVYNNKNRMINTILSHDQDEAAQAQAMTQSSTHTIQPLPQQQHLHQAS